MVGPTPALGNVKAALRMLSKINHPGPLTHQESQKLLTSINSSFRKHLDKEHPLPGNGDDAGGTSKLEATRQRRPTDQHLLSIVSNPLFATSHGPDRPKTRSNPTHNDVFDLAVSRGMMTTTRAAGFLAAIENELLPRFSAGDLREAMARSGAGLRVLQWLRASGQEDDLRFLQDGALTRRLVSSMLAESLDEIVWSWLSRLGARLESAQIDTVTEQCLSNIFVAIMMAQHSWGRSSGLSLDDDYSSLIRAHQTLPLNNYTVARDIRSQWRRLSWNSTMNMIELPIPKPSTPLFEEFVNIGRQWDKKLDMAHLELHHPSSPSHFSAIDYLHNLSTKRTADAQASLSKGHWLGRRMLGLGTDTVHRLEDVGLKDEASWVNEFMSRTFFAWNVERQLADIDVKGIPVT